jgi:tRNA-binding EMAP/Myf-like protein
MEVKANHQVNVVRIPEIKKHPNADTLGLVHFGGYQVVVKLGEFEEGDLGYYIQPDSVVPVRDEFKFLWAGRVIPCDDPKNLLDDEVPTRYRRIKSRKFRGEWSEGLLMPLEHAYKEGSCILRDDAAAVFTKDQDYELVYVGDDISGLLGITHYDPDEERDREQQHQRREQFKRWPRSLKGWFYFVCFHLGINYNGVVHGQGNEKGPKDPPPIYDVDALKNFPDVFEPFELVRVTEKIHGSNGRYIYQDGHMYAGSRKLWKGAKSGTIWRKVLNEHPEIEVWCKKHPGSTLFVEVTPTQKWKSGKLSGKHLTYGAPEGKSNYFAFDILTPDGEWGPINDEHLNKAPVLYEGPYTSQLFLMVDGPSHVPGTSHLREGIVIRAVPERRVRGTFFCRAQLKVVSNEFLNLT